MPKKKDRCVKKLIAEGYSEERAWAICTAALDGNIVVGMKDKAVNFESNIDEDTGFLHVKAVIARTGIQKYLASELGDEGNEVVGVFRPVKEVTAEKSIKSFTNSPITDNHPMEMVTIDNYKQYAKGSNSSVNVIQLDSGETGLETMIVITDKDLINSIKEGKKELSVGYENILVQESGTHDGEDYEYVQTNILANHIAVVDAGRCGGVCKLMVDILSIADEPIKNEGEKMVKITINGVEFEVAEEVAEELKRLQEAKTATEEDAEEKEKENTEAMDKLQATVDTLGVDKAKLTKNLNDSKGQLGGAVADKIALLDTAKSAGVVCKATDTNLAIKQAIVKSFDMDVDGKSETYLDAAIEIKRVELNDKQTREDKAQLSFDKIGGEYKGAGKTVDYDAIGEKTIGQGE